MKNRHFRTVEEMDRVLIANFNAVVRKSDTVYILGDLCHHMQVEMCNRVVAKFNGSKILISGNHDWQYDSSLFTDIRDFLTVTLDGVCFSLMHYPLLSWPKKEHGSVQLHGHIHAGTDYNEQIALTGSGVMTRALIQ
jgi:calcineurin-like phosphoesterase family protein